MTTSTLGTPRTLGSTGPSTAAIGLGLMGMSDLYGPADDAESVATIQAALDAGVTLLDTGDFYGMGHNEMLLRDAIRGRRRENAADQREVRRPARCPAADGTAWTPVRRPSRTSWPTPSGASAPTTWTSTGRPAWIRPFRSKKPWEHWPSSCSRACIRHIGLSEVGADTLRRANAVHPVSDLQIEYSLLSRGIEQDILPVARELGIGITAYGVLSRGLVSGHWPAAGTGNRRDFRAHLPRFSGENLQRNLELVERLREIADRKGATVAQLAIAWVLSRGEDIVPLVGARRRERLAESLGAAELVLSGADLAEIEAAVPADAAAGTRYDAGQMAMLDSERR